MADVEIAWTNLDKPAKQYESGRTPDGKKAHPTQKPVALMHWCLSQFLGTSLIYDPFLGSGTTLIAAQQLGRKCYGIEIEPRYVDVICQRFLNLTGESPIRESDGAAFASCKPTR